jgi:hypothetical protein
MKRIKSGIFRPRYQSELLEAASHSRPDKYECSILACLLSSSEITWIARLRAQQFVRECSNQYVVLRKSNQVS